jgi:hypothetical protein
MNVSGVVADIQRELKRRKYILRLEVMDQTVSIIKARLYITPDLFVQVYRNDHYDTTNLVLVHGGRRLYGRDQIGGQWHRHTYSDPDRHDFSDDGRKAIELADFLNEVESLLTELDLP